jgi:hypothetical protein
MATGASSQLAGLCGVRAAVAPLLWLAIVEAAGIAVLGIVRRGAHGRVRLASWLRPGVPSEHMGELTVPLGLAVTATGLAAQRGAFASSLLPVCCVLASLAAVALFARVLAAVAIRRDCALIPRSRLITHRERTPQRRHAPIAESALLPSSEGCRVAGPGTSRYVHRGWRSEKLFRSASWPPLLLR